MSPRGAYHWMAVMFMLYIASCDFGPHVKSAISLTTGIQSTPLVTPLLKDNFIRRTIFSLPTYINVGNMHYGKITTTNQRSQQQLQAPISVSQLTARIRATIEENFFDVAVVGEVSNFKTHSSGHWYFSLKDKFATLPCACFRKSNNTVRFDLQDGLKVVARGRVEVYAPKGTYQLIVTSLEPVGIGQWQLAFEQLKERLERDGLLDPEKKRAIPLMPRKIGIVTSPTGAAIRDILTALRRRNPNVQAVISPTRVQGDGSEYEIAQAIRDIQKIPGVEVIIVARGGGSIEDLWCFNTEVVARAVSTCAIPVISGIGHETDVTICDLVADLRAPTPTAAAELVSRGHAELSQRWSSLRRLLLVRMEHRLMQAHRSLERLNPRHALARQEERLKKLHLILQSKAERLISAMQAKITDRTHRLQKLENKLQAISPTRTLSRGYAIIRLADGAVLQDASQVAAGDTVEAWLSKGKLRLRVEEYLGDWNAERIVAEAETIPVQKDISDQQLKLELNEHERGPEE